MRRVLSAKSITAIRRTKSGWMPKQSSAAIPALGQPIEPSRPSTAVAAAMKEVRTAGRGHPDVNHLHGDIWQIEIDGQAVIYRLLFAEEGRFGQVLLALEIVNKKWQKARSRHIQLADRRLREWRRRGSRKAASPGTSSVR